MAVASILDMRSITASFWSQNADAYHFSIDGTTNTFGCERQGTAGFEASLSHGQMPIAQGLHVYAHNNCPNCDAIKYKIKGCTRSTSDWTKISEGDITWSSMDRNSILGDPSMISRNESGDSSLVKNEVMFDNGVVL